MSFGFFWIIIRTHWLLLTTAAASWWVLRWLLRNSAMVIGQYFAYSYTTPSAAFYYVARWFSFKMHQSRPTLTRFLAIKIRSGFQQCFDWRLRHLLRSSAAKFAVISKTIPQPKAADCQIWAMKDCQCQAAWGHRSRPDPDVYTPQGCALRRTDFIHAFT